MRQKGITKEWVEAVHPPCGPDSKTADGVVFRDIAPPTAIGFKDYGNIERKDIDVEYWQNTVEKERGWLKPSPCTGLSNGFAFWPDMSDEKRWDE